MGERSGVQLRTSAESDVAQSKLRDKAERDYVRRLNNSEDKRAGEGADEEVARDQRKADEREKDGDAG